MRKRITNFLDLIAVMIITIAAAILSAWLFAQILVTFIYMGVDVRNILLMCAIFFAFVWITYRLITNRP